MIDRQQLLREAAAVGVSLDDAQMQVFDRYAQLLVEWNEKINLTAITQPEGIVTRHFADSLALLGAVQPAQGVRLADVGAGAGFPSLPVLIVRPDLRATLLDSLNKRIVFLQTVSQELGLFPACVHLRAEEAGQKAEYRAQFDLVTARAVAHLRELAEYCLPLVKTGGIFAALKGGEVEEELGEAAKAIGLLGGRVREIKRFSLADASGRSIIVIEKISQTSTKYPRSHAKMVKSPL